ncbi:MAG TPA: FtsX-like permease family protein [Caulobacterales bacterium]|nr:FtsX-like permease family protein [Caulobacterales bacterium]
MNGRTLVSKNLWRKPLRTTLLIVSIFVAFLLFGVLGSFNYFFQFAPNPEGANRMMTVNKINFTQPLPFAYVNRVRTVPGVTHVAFQNWFGGYYRDPRNLVQTFSVPPEDYRQVYGNTVKMPDAEWQAFINDRTGLILSRSFAVENNLHIGDHIPLKSNIYTNRNNGQQMWEFTVRGIFDTNGPNSAYFNYEYFRESATFGVDNVGMIVFTTDSPKHNDAVAHRIDAMFANSPAETSTQDELAFFRAFIAQRGNISFIITLVVGAAFIAILLVVGNTMMMAVRERTKEIGVLKTLGFTSERIMRMVLGESLLLSLIGAFFGLGLAALGMFLIGQAPNFHGLNMPPVVAGVGVALALLFGLITGLAPSVSALNLKIVDALGRK